MRGKSILPIVGGGIAAYKACELVRLIRKADTRELGRALLPKPIETFIDCEFVIAHEAPRDSPLRISAEAR